MTQLQCSINSLPQTGQSDVTATEQFLWAALAGLTRLTWNDQVADETCQPRSSSSQHRSHHKRITRLPAPLITTSCPRLQKESVVEATQPCRQLSRVSREAPLSKRNCLLLISPLYSSSVLTRVNSPSSPSPLAPGPSSPPLLTRVRLSDCDT